MAEVCSDDYGLPRVVIRRTEGWAPLRLSEIWKYRELLYFFVWSHVKVRYKQTVLGATWAVLQPFLTMVVFTIVFSRFAQVRSDGLPYPLFSFTGLLPWTFFAQAVTSSSASLVGYSNLIKKVYFPRLILPTAFVISALIDFLVAAGVLCGMMAYYGLQPPWQAVFFPLLFVLAFTTALGAGLWLSALNVEYRDVHLLVPFSIQLGLFLTPVIYPASSVMKELGRLGIPGWLYGINPMAGVVEGFRWTLLGTPSAPRTLILASGLTAFSILVSGALYFRRVEKTFADIV